MTITALSVASELFPLVKTGGLGDVVAALPAALAREDIAVRTLLPGYPAVLGAVESAEPVLPLADLFGGPARVLAARAVGHDLFVIDAPHLFGRPGNPYLGPDGADWPDNAQRFAALGWVAAELGRGTVPGFVPDVLHAHDWQAGLAPAYLHYGGRPAPGTLMTVHNLAFKGRAPAHLLGALRLPAEAFSIDGVEYYGEISLLKAGLQLADRVSTVSPTYADEICTDAGGMGLGGLFRARAGVLSGILNGIDLAIWDPTTDRALAARYDAARLPARAANKEAVQSRFGLAVEAGTLLVGVVSRLTEQKGMDILAVALPALLAAGAQLALLGSGEAAIEATLAQAAQAHPGRVGVTLGYDEELAHLIQGGADVLAVPSRFEPCGLTQLCALRYGALPLVSRVGGLADTVIDANEMASAAGVATGFQFAPVASEALEAAVGRAARLWRNRPLWRRMQANAMATRLGWDSAAAHYAALYREISAAARL